MAEIFGFDAYSPKEIAEQVEKIGVAKARLPLLSMMGLGVLAGGFIGLGALYSTLITSDPNLSFGISRLLGGLAFSLGLILVGGFSRRMGAPKDAMRVQGRSVLSCPAELLASRLGEVWAIGSLPPRIGRPRFLGWRPDYRPGYGPLRGIATALRIARGEKARGGGVALEGPREPRAVLVLACDMPGMAREAVDLLLEGRRPDRLASALGNPTTGRLEPLAAVYEPDALQEVERALEAGHLSPADLLQSLQTHEIETPVEIADQLMNVNTPRDLKAIRERTMPPSVCGDRRRGGPLMVPGSPSIFSINIHSLTPESAVGMALAIYSQKGKL